MSKIPKFRLFAGPNGSGKSTLISEISKTYILGVFVNADNLEYELGKRKFIELAGIFGNNPPLDPAWNSFFENYKAKDSRSKGFDSESLEMLRRRTS